MSGLKSVSRRCVRMRPLLLALVALCAAHAHAQRKAGDLNVKPYVFENAKGEKTDAEFGTLIVPENRGDPRSNLIELAFVCFKSTSNSRAAPAAQASARRRARASRSSWRCARWRT
jgi:hypothetical protein